MEPKIKEQKDAVTLTIKGIPKEVLESFRKKAYANRRSVNQEIILLIETVVKAA